MNETTIENEEIEEEKDQCSTCGTELTSQEVCTCVSCDAKEIDGKVVVLDSQELNSQLRIIDEQLACGYNGIMDALDNESDSKLEESWKQTDLHEIRDFMQNLYPVFRKLGLRSSEKALKIYHEKLDEILGDPGRKGEQG